MRAHPISRYEDTDQAVILRDKATGAAVSHAGKIYRVVLGRSFGDGTAALILTEADGDIVHAPDELSVTFRFRASRIGALADGVYAGRWQQASPGGGWRPLGAITLTLIGRPQV